MAVVVQIMVDARTAGVMFTRSPTTGDRSVMTIEGAWGLGSAVVGGEVTPDRWVIGKITGEISARAISDKAIQHVPRDCGRYRVARRCPMMSAYAACMSDEELQRLRDIGRRVERHYGRAQDIEWAVERSDGQILLLQSRPETVWSAREAAPVARAADNPLDACDVDLRRPIVTLTSKDVAEITRLLEESVFTELHLEIDGLKIDLKRGTARHRRDPPRHQHSRRSRRHGPRHSQRAPVAAPEPADQHRHTVAAPLLGTFYRAPKPGRRTVRGSRLSGG